MRRSAVPGALAATFLVLLGVLTAGAAALRANVLRFAARLHGRVRHRLCELDRRQLRPSGGGHAGRPAKFGLTWSLKLTNEGGFIVALLAGLVIANFFPRLADWLKEAIRPELYIKIAIVILGAFLAVDRRRQARRSPVRCCCAASRRSSRPI